MSEKKGRDRFMNLREVGQDLVRDIAKWMPEDIKEGQVSYYVGRLDDQGALETLAAYDDRLVHAGASMVKTLIMEYLFYLAQEGLLDIKEKVSLEEVPLAEGGGALQELSPHHSFTYLELCRLMMVLSDNWATNLLLHRLGMDAINERARQIGLETFEIQRYMMDGQARAQGRENRITAYDMAKLLAHIYGLRDSSSYGQEMWRILGRQQFRDHIPFHWGEEVPFHHKTGCLENVEHDGGIYPALHGAYVIVILMSHIPNDKAIAASAHMGRLIKANLDRDFA